MGDNYTTRHNATLTQEMKITLLFIYNVVLIGGIVSIAFIARNLKSNIRSVTTLAVMNLILVHSLFLLTIPFRIYYYASERWDLTPAFCKVVSAMLHLHMHLSFVFYMIILITRYLTFFRRRDSVEFYRNLHSLLASVAVWVIVMVFILPALISKYGVSEGDNKYTCFHYGKVLENAPVAVLNYVISGATLLAVCVLTCLQVYILFSVLRMHGAFAYAHQEFRAQMKSLCFVLVLLVCYVPYHIFRIYYVSQISRSRPLDAENEVFLAVSSFNCFDMLIFAWKGSYWKCNKICSFFNGRP